MHGLVQPELGDVLRIGLQFAALDLGDEIGQHGVGAAGDADLLAVGHHEAVHEIDLERGLTSTAGFDPKPTAATAAAESASEDRKLASARLRKSIRVELPYAIK